MGPATYIVSSFPYGKLSTWWTKIQAYSPQRAAAEYVNPTRNPTSNAVRHLQDGEPLYYSR